MDPIISFHQHWKNVCKLSKSSRTLLDIFVFSMRPSDNLFYLGEDRIDQYLAYCKKHLEVSYSRKTVREAISELTKAEVVYRAGKNNYIVNPDLFVKPEGLSNIDKIHREIDHYKKFIQMKREGKYCQYYPLDNPLDQNCNSKLNITDF